MAPASVQELPPSVEKLKPERPEGLYGVQAGLLKGGPHRPR